MASSRKRGCWFGKGVGPRLANLSGSGSRKRQNVERGRGSALVLKAKCHMKEKTQHETRNTLEKDQNREKTARDCVERGSQAEERDSG